MRVILLGAPGSGKGSVGERLREATGFPWISTGDLLREAVRDRTPLGLRAESQLGKGGLVDDETVLGLLRERLSRPDCRDGYILDGYPRNLEQAATLEKLDGDRPEIVFDIDAREDVVVRRLSSRRICPSCEAIYNTISKRPKKEGVCDVCGAALVQRTDDRAEIIPERMRTYRAKTEPLVSHYAARGTLHRIDANGTIEETVRPIQAVLDGLLTKGSRGGR
ncbi:MAG: nucleoside monophosphate kinase [Candidatus Aminicenantes bacterium]|nr:nucleoside monophosphate kinase [Candidatus Aminicenantes bacterium]